MLACLALFQMLHMHLSDAAHEIGGVLFGILLVVHVVQHHRWFALLAKGPWKAIRIVNAAVVICLLLCACAMLFSGLAMSGWAVEAGTGGSSVARAIHLPLVHIGFCLLAVHAGLQMRRVFAVRSTTATRGAATKVLLAAAAVAVAAFALWSLADLDFVGYVLGTTGFAFVDPAKSVAFSVLQYAAIFALFCGMGYALDEQLRIENGEKQRARKENI